MMRALLLAAGLGTRLRPLTNETPKCLVPIHGQPLLAYWFDLLLSHDEIERVLVNTHYLPDQVRGFIEQSKWRDKIDVVYEERLLGTGGTVLHQAPFFKGEPFMVVHADNLSSFDVGGFIASHKAKEKHCAMTMMTFETDQPSNSGIVEIDAHGVVVGFHEKVANPPGVLANGAVYILDQEVVSFMHGLDSAEIDLSTQVLPYFVGRINTFFNGDYHRDIGTYESLQKAEAEFPR